MSRLQFKLEKKATGSQARAARFTTLHGEVQTPIFMPVGTQATVKGSDVDTLKTVGSRVLLANTYHLLLRPGPEVFQKFGGIHRFMNWDGPVLTDSGGFQIFSLPHSREMNEDGARFQSYVDGRMLTLSPEVSIGMQKAIGSDIMMVLDQCIPSTSSHAEATAAMELTHRWALRSLQARGESPQSLFGIVQGACFHDLRRKSAEVITQMPFDGFAIGGLAVGETREKRDEFTEATAKLLPENLPRYLMGVGTPTDLLEAIHRGVDMFDCILPSQLAQRGVAFTSHGKLQLRRTVYRFTEIPVDEDCVCDTCAHYSRAYLHHLIKTDELLGWQLLTTHNLTYYHRMMREIRASILEDRFLDYYHTKKPELLQSDEENPVTTPKKSKKRRDRWQRLGDYELHCSPAGFTSIRQSSSGEIMHSVSDPILEAKRLYIEQSSLADRLKQPAERPLVIWDVGLGAATNAMAAIQCAEAVYAAAATAPSRLLELVSFERDLDPLRLASKHPVRFPQMRHPAPYQLLEAARWTDPSGKIQWTLLEGDFLERMKDAAVPDLIFYDPFSFKTDSPLWTRETFQKIRRVLGNHRTEIYTYSKSTAVRSALLGAGFWVGSGIQTGPKSETTRAFLGPTDSDLPAAGPFLGAEWLARWERSQAKFPSDLPEEKRASFETLIRSHPQFSFRE